MKTRSIASRARSLSERLSALLVVSSLTLVTAACGQQEGAKTEPAPTATTTPAATPAVPPAPEAQAATSTTPDNPCAPKARKKPKNPCE
jgi:hypothetical protein